MFKLFAGVAILAALSLPANAETVASIDGLKEQVRIEVGKNCEVLEFADGFTTAVNVNGDGRDDLLVNYKSLLCDGSSTLFCGSAGCPLILYLQDARGSYTRLTEFFGYNITFDHPDGTYPSFVVALHGNECNRSGIEPCAIRYEIVDGEIKEIGEVEMPADQ